MDGPIELNRALNLPLHIGEFLFSISEFAEYIQKGVLNVARLIAITSAVSAARCAWDCWRTPSAWSARRTIGATFSTSPSTSILSWLY
jgi:hypothetical protein